MVKWWLHTKIDHSHYSVRVVFCRIGDVAEAELIHLGVSDPASSMNR